MVFELGFGLVVGWNNLPAKAGLKPDDVWLEVAGVVCAMPKTANVARIAAAK
jgi:hypothetical protein